ncbi:MAG: glycosyltransferase family 1 protein [Gammaproteobacteria bacterium]
MDTKAANADDAVEPGLHIALVTETWPPEVNGVAHTLSQLVRGLHKRGHSIQVIRPRQGRDDRPQTEGAYQELLVGGAPLPGYPGLHIGLPARRAIQRSWRVSMPDVIYIATEGPLGGSALKAARRLGIPTVTGFHTNFDYYSRYYGIGFLETVITGFLRRFHNRSRATLVPTRALKQDLEARGFANVNVLARGVDTTLFNPVRRSDELRRSWDVNDDALAIVYVGRLAAEKNLSLAAQAFRGIEVNHPGARFVLVGDGPEAEPLKAQNPDFVFCGTRRGEDLARHYASGDIFLFPSTSETYGNVVIEAMASGLAVVSFDDAAAHEHIRDGQNGLLATPNDPAAFIRAATDLADAPQRIAALRTAARDTTDRLDWEHIFDQLEAILLEHAQRGLRHELASAYE